MPDDARMDGPRQGFIRRFLRLAGGYFTSDQRYSAWGLTAAVLALSLLQIAVQVRYNVWYRDFFNALDSRNASAFFGQMWLFLILTAAGMSTAVLHLYTKQLLQLRWRTWLVCRLQDQWLDQSRHYHMGFLQDAADNPDQRISENTRHATAMAVDLAVGFFQSALMLIAFVGILWTLSGPLPVPIGEDRFEIPGYMVFVAVLYASLGSGLTYLIGRPRVDINVRRNQAESDHRFSLVRLRENSESVALIRGEPDEERGLRRSFDRVVSVMRELMLRERRLMWLTSAYAMLSAVFPVLVASPRYFAGAITLGVLMQIASAFQEVTRSLNWFVDNFPRLADWCSHIERVVELEDSFDAVEATEEDQTITLTSGLPPGGREVLAFRELSIGHPDGNVMIQEANAEIGPGERVLIVGESGSGKSTLFRAIAGIWPWGAGEISTPPRDAMMFMPQRPYLPIGSLQAAVSYPGRADQFSDAEVRTALARVGLPHLASRLHEEERWDRILSLGEQQRLAFVRLLLHRPRWVLMDEATSALDEANQDAMMRLFREELPDSALVSIGHRPGLDAYHDRTLTLVRTPDGAKLTTRRRRPAPQRPVRGMRFGERALRRMLRRRAAGG